MRRCLGKLNFDDCIYIDNKYFHDVGFTPAQNKIVNAFNGGSNQAVVTLNQSTEMLNGFIIAENTVLTINRVEVFTANDILDLVNILKKP